METKVNYAMVGMFVLALGAAFIAGILWLAGGLGGKKDYVFYQSIVNESVAGLNIDAPVKYLGVDIGKVRTIKLDPVNPQQVKLIFAIEKGIPIKQDTQAVLKTQGLTGIAYVELSGGAPDSPVLVAKDEGQLPMIPNRPSLSRRLENVLTTTLANLDRTTAAINDLLDEENRAAFKRILVDTSLLMHSVSEQRSVIATGLVNAAKTADNTARATQQLDPLMIRLTKSATSLEKMSKDVSATTTKVSATFGNIDNGIGKITGETLPEMNRLLGELGLLATSLQNLTEQTERNPSSLLWGQRPVAPGPGEKGAPK